MYIEVVLPVPVGSTFTYRVPEDMAADVSIGSRVIVPFGKNKFYTGIVSGLAVQPEAIYTIKEVTHLTLIHNSEPTRQEAI